MNVKSDIRVARWMSERGVFPARMRMTYKQTLEDYNNETSGFYEFVDVEFMITFDDYFKAWKDFNPEDRLI